MKIILVLLFCYLIGAVPFAFILTRLITGKDVRQFGSGNVGATNATRVMGLKFGIVVAIADILKGFFAVFVAQLLLPGNLPEYFLLMAAIMAIIGHNWSIFLKFSGGRGVAATFGVLLKLFPLSFIIFTIIWLTIVVLTRYVSLASISAAISVPLSVYLLKGNYYNFIFALILAFFVIIRHQSNIRRLIHGRENRMKWPPGKKGDT